MGRLALLAWLVALPAAAQQGDAGKIRLFAQADDVLLPTQRRTYSTRFDAARLRMLGVELTGAQTVDCTLTRPDGSQVPAEHPLAQGAGLLWGGSTDWQWQPGRYVVECRSESAPAMQAEFDVSVNPPEVMEGDIRVAAIRTFPVEGELPPKPHRRYTALLVAAETRRIGVEIEFSHAPLGRKQKVPVDCWFFWPDGQTSPPLELNYEPEPDWAGGYSAGVMGFPDPGSWMAGVYTVTCAIRSQPVAVERFQLE